MKSFILNAYFIIFLVCSGMVSAHGYYANENRDLYGMPRSSGMAKADVALYSHGFSATTPAALGGMQKMEIDFSHAGYFGNAFSTSRLAYALPLNNDMGFGLSLDYLRVPEIPITKNLPIDSEGNPIWDPHAVLYESFSEVFISAALGRSFVITPRITLLAGASIHAQRRHFPADAGTGYGIGVDAAVAARLKKYNLDVALLVHDVTTNYLSYGDYHDGSGPRVHVGIGYEKDVPYFYGLVRIGYRTADVFSGERMWISSGPTPGVSTVAAENDIGAGIQSFLYMSHYGFEYEIRETVTARFGFSEGSFAFGGGIALFSRAFSVDFAYSTSELEGSYILGISCRF